MANHKVQKVDKPEPQSEQQFDLLATRAEQLPDYLRGQAGAGMESIQQEDVEIPRLKLLQALSPELKLNDSFKAGQWFHTISERSLGKTVRVVTIHANQSFILWRPRKSGGGILARALDGLHWSPAHTSFNVKLDNGRETVWRVPALVTQSSEPGKPGLTDWGSTDKTDPSSPPAATRMYNLVVLPIDYPALGPAVVTMQRASIKVARKLFGKLKLATATAPLYGLMFELSSEDAKNAAGQEFIMPRWTPVGFTPKELATLCTGLYEKFKEFGVRIRDVEDLQGEEAETPADEGAEGGNKF